MAVVAHSRRLAPYLALLVSIATFVAAVPAQRPRPPALRPPGPSQERTAGNIEDDGHVEDVQGLLQISHNAGMGSREQEPADVNQQVSQDWGDIWGPLPRALDRFEHAVSATPGEGGAEDPNDSSTAGMPTSGSEWEPVLRAQALTHARRRAEGSGSFHERLNELAFAVPTDEWLFFMSGLVVLLAMDVVVLQHLPETDRTHTTLLIFWCLVAAAFCTEAWFRLGPIAGEQWVTGYFMEVLYSVDNIFVFYLVFSVFETPTRLMAKALSVTLMGGIVSRTFLFLGLASVLDSAVVITYSFGFLLIYWGLLQAFASEREEADVTQSAAVRWLSRCMGDRLGKFYDEDGEAVFLWSECGRKGMQVTLLGPVILVLMGLDLLLSKDGALAKADRIPNAYLNIASSALALFTVRALFFALRGFFARHAVLSRFGLGAGLVIMGARVLLAHVWQVNAMTYCIALANVVVASLAISVLVESKASQDLAAPCTPSAVEAAAEAES